MKRLFFILSVLGILAAQNAEAATMVLAGSSFSPDTLSPCNIGSTVAGVVRLYAYADSASCWAYRDIPLPSGTVISSIEVIGKDDSSDCNFRAKLYRNYSSYHFSTISSDTSDDTGDQTLSLSGTTLSSTSAYTVAIDISDTGTANCQVYRVKINY